MDLNEDGIIDSRDVFLFIEGWQERDFPTLTPTPTLTTTSTTVPTDSPTFTPIPTATATPLTIDLPGLATGARPLQLVRIPAGNFLMGNTGSARDAQYGDADEYPQHVGGALFLTVGSPGPTSARSSGELGVHFVT
jgi:hypothetical protein